MKEKRAKRGLKQKDYMLGYLYKDAIEGHRRDHPELFTAPHAMAVHGPYLGWFHTVLELQGGKCANPRCTGTGTGHIDRVAYLVVDHDHATGQFRGLLCSGCNLAIGNVAEDRERLLGLAEYLSPVVTKAVAG